MRFTVGYQADDGLKSAVMDSLDSGAEIYFPWSGFTSGRGVLGGMEAQRRLEADLDEYAAAGLKTSLLLNGNCYGRYAQSRTFFNSIGDAVHEISERWGLGSVTTTSPLIAKFVKANFKEIEVRASVNMEVGSIEGMEYIEPMFDAFYFKRECNYDISALRRARAWCAERGKKLYLLANSGCLNFCSAHNFHDNLVAHQHEIAEMDNAFEFKGVCHIFLGDEKAKAGLLRHSNFIRPEDVAIYEDLCDGMKLATRTNRNPSAVVRAFCNGKFGGNLLELTEPSHAEHLYPSIISNGSIPVDFAVRKLNCDKKCEVCGYCDKVQKAATVNLDDMGL